MHRPWFALLTALLFGATLSTPVAAGAGVYESKDASIDVAVETAVSLLSGTDPDSEDSHVQAPLVFPLQGAASTETFLAFNPVPPRLATLPPARAPPAYL